MGLANVSECCSIAAATQGWASCSNSARPAPKKIAASLSTCQVIDPGPNTPASEPAAAPCTRLSSRSRFSALTISSGSRSVGAFILVASIPNSADLCDDRKRRKSCPVRAAGNAVGPAGDVLPLEHAFLKNRALLVATAESTSSQRSIGARQKLYRLDHLEHGKTPAVTAIERGRDAAAAQIRQRIGIRAHEIGHVNIVSNAGAVRCRVVGAEDIHF